MIKIIEGKFTGKNWNKQNIMAGVGLPRKIDDISELKEELIDIFLTKNHKDISHYGLLLAEHILNLVNLQSNNTINEVFKINIKWQEGKAKFQEARNAAGKILTMAREEKDPIKEKVLRIMAQIANIPHVARHALIASDYSIKLINLMYLKNFEEIEKERKIQIELMKNV
jgi:hypothetical protein